LSTTEVTIAWWNRKWNGGADRQVRFLEQFEDWDVLALAEVTRSAYERFRVFADASYFTLDDVHVSDRRYPHGIAILARRGWTVSDAAPFSCSGDDDLVCRPERGVAATIARGHARTRLIGWQAPYAAGRTSLEKRRNPLIKRHGYEHLLQRLDAEPRPVIVAMDGNNWGDSLAPSPVISAVGDPWHVEHHFHGPEPQHGLIDSLREIKRRDPNQHAYLGDSPLAVTKITPRAGQHRMDRIYVSPDLFVEDAGVTYSDPAGQVSDAAGGLVDLRRPTAGSDHALVWARLLVS